MSARHATIDVTIHVTDLASEVLRAVSEKLFQGQVSRQAKGWGWHGFHDTVAWRSDPGWPDNVFVRPGRLVVAELKRVGGKLTPKQREWLMWWWESGRCDGPYVWDPTCWTSIAKVLAPEGVTVLARPCQRSGDVVRT